MTKPTKGEIKQAKVADTTLAQHEVALLNRPLPKAPSAQGIGFNIESLISQAITSGVPVDTMEKLLAMRRELKAEWAKEQYDKAMSAFQSACPTIRKTKEVRANNGTVAYAYAPIESIVAQVKDLLAKHGFSYSTSMEVLPDGVKVVCKVTHASGHSEESPMQVPLGTKTAMMSASQVTASAQTFAKRYAFCNAFGILTGDEDNDGATHRIDPGEAQATQVASKPTSAPNAAAQARNLPTTMDDVALAAAGIKKLMGMVSGMTLRELEDYRHKVTVSDKYTMEQKHTFIGFTEQRLKNLRESEKIGDDVR